VRGAVPAEDVPLRILSRANPHLRRGAILGSAPRQSVWAPPCTLPPGTKCTEFWRAPESPIKTRCTYGQQEAFGWPGTWCPATRAGATLA